MEKPKRDVSEDDVLADILKVKHTEGMPKSKPPKKKPKPEEKPEKQA